MPALKSPQAAGLASAPRRAGPHEEAPDAVGPGAPPRRSACSSLRAAEAGRSRDGRADRHERPFFRPCIAGFAGTTGRRTALRVGGGFSDRGPSRAGTGGMPARNPGGACCRSCPNPGRSVHRASRGGKPGAQRVASRSASRRARATDPARRDLVQSPGPRASRPECVCRPPACARLTRAALQLCRGCSSGGRPSQSLGPRDPENTPSLCGRPVAFSRRHRDPLACAALRPARAAFPLTVGHRRRKQRRCG